MKDSEIKKDIVVISKDYMKNNMKAIKIGDLLDVLLKKYGIKRFEDSGSNFKDKFSEIVTSMIKSEIIKEVPKGYIVVVPGSENNIKESRTFSDHLKYLSESIDVEHEFSDEMYEKLKALKFAVNGSAGYFYSNIHSDGKVSKILTIVPTDDENEVELRVYNYKVQDDSLYLEGKNVKIKNLEKIKDVVKSLETYVEAESKFLSDWSKS